MNEVEEYLKNLDPDQLKEFERIRSIVRSKLPDAREVISYKVPTFKYEGQPVLYVGTFKQHMSIFPTSGPIRKLASKLSEYEVNKGTIRFTLNQPLPEALIEEIIDLRVNEIKQKAKKP
jgi:uncharacterized protein YdhG (YjbR/CyaY superfamily)